ncbi:MAG TPA: alcohol dehydrogenase catalytic domain-containing protein [Acidimicrobiales bacterium]|jgi:threonine dehydrogenase-like Zn-dependent dehydrogenase|nr:alcohol dehydrogenase catalytic domain-containing protein [Acidimicrobiales bacterium]
MRAVRNAPPGVEVVDVDEPDGDGALIRVAAAGICASDLQYLRYESREIAGHEFAGVLDDGTAVAVEPIFGCGGCPQCDRGNFNRCLSGPTALGMLSAGGMSEYFRAPRHALIPVPPGLSLQDASLVEPASVAWHGCHQGSIGPDTSVAVVGGGAIGILAGASAQTMGVDEVAIEVRHPHQVDARDLIGAVAPSGHYDVVLETGGSESSLHRAVELARPGGTVVYMGVFDDIAWPSGQSFMKEVAIRPSLGYCGHNGRREFAEAADMLASRPELARTLITHRFPIEDAAEAFRVSQDRSGGSFRVVIEP